ncbi:MAG: hypothetical protein WCG23_10605 [bacterium]
MSNIVVVMEKKPTQGTLTRIINKFESTNPIKQAHHGVIKNYVYVEQKRILA